MISCSQSNVDFSSEPAPLIIPTSPVAEEIGGSNFAVYNAGNYLGQWTEEAWRDGSLRPTVVTYHLDPFTVENQLKIMKSGGQEKIALVIWFSELQENLADHETRHHVINSNSGRLPVQMESNLRSLMNLIIENEFNEVQIRIGYQWLSDPVEWEEWHEDRYQSSFSFVQHVREILEQESIGSNIKKVYDLGLKRGGRDVRQNLTYIDRFWQEYSEIYGSDDTYGFSLKTSAEDLRRQWEIYENSGHIPDVIALNLYGENPGEIEANLNDIYDEMKKLGISEIPVLIQETYYDSASTLVEINNMKKKGMRFKSIMQWPLTREGDKAGHIHLSVDSPTSYESYLKEL